MFRNFDLLVENVKFHPTMMIEELIPSLAISNEDRSKSNNNIYNLLYQLIRYSEFSLWKCNELYKENMLNDKSRSIEYATSVKLFFSQLFYPRNKSYGQKRVFTAP